MMKTVQEVTEMIKGGGLLFVSGDEALLRSLPKGRWVGGTIPYFMTDEGGQTRRDRLFVTQVDAPLKESKFAWYDERSIKNIATDAYANGFSYVIVPAGSSTHTTYAKEAPQFEDVFLKPIIGWVAGVHLEVLGQVTPKVFNGETLEVSDSRAIVVHVAVSGDKQPLVKTVNIFKQGDGPTFEFNDDGFEVRDCLRNGETVNLARYLADSGVDTKLPLTADYCGTVVNVSIQSVDVAAGKVVLYAPVFKGVKYRFAAPVADYVKAFQAALPSSAKRPVFACNCILNYLYSQLEGKKTGTITGPMTFGEIAHQLLNQTMVYLDLV